MAQMNLWIAELDEDRKSEATEDPMGRLWEGYVSGRLSKRPWHLAVWDVGCCWFDVFGATKDFSNLDECCVSASIENLWIDTLTYAKKSQ